MRPARQLLNRLLNETDTPEDADLDMGSAKDFLLAATSDDRVTAYCTASHFWHRTKTYSDGIRPIEVRRNGRTQTWKTRPLEFRIPVKYGMYDTFNITQHNAAEWTTVRPPDKVRQPKPKKS